jgi:hypothetical protein
MRMRKLFFLLMLITMQCKTTTAQVIDMHMHSYIEMDFWTGKARNGLNQVKQQTGTLKRQ